MLDEGDVIEAFSGGQWVLAKVVGCSVQGHACLLMLKYPEGGKAPIRVTVNGNSLLRPIQPLLEPKDCQVTCSICSRIIVVPGGGETFCPGCGWIFRDEHPGEMPKQLPPHRPVTFQDAAKLHPGTELERMVCIDHKPIWVPCQVVSISNEFGPNGYDIKVELRGEHGGGTWVFRQDGTSPNSDVRFPIEKEKPKKNRRVLKDINPYSVSLVKNPPPGQEFKQVFTEEMIKAGKRDAELAILGLLEGPQQQPPAEPRLKPGDYLELGALYKVTKVGKLTKHRVGDILQAHGKDIFGWHELVMPNAPTLAGTEFREGYVEELEPTRESEKRALQKERDSLRWDEVFHLGSRSEEDGTWGQLQRKREDGTWENLKVTKISFLGKAQSILPGGDDARASFIDQAGKRGRITVGKECRGAPGWRCLRVQEHELDRPPTDLYRQHNERMYKDLEPRGAELAPLWDYEACTHNLLHTGIGKEPDEPEPAPEPPFLKPGFCWTCGHAKGCMHPRQLRCPPEE
jgi:hypothetical protein